MKRHASVAIPAIAFCLVLCWQPSVSAKTPLEKTLELKKGLINSTVLTVGLYDQVVDRILLLSIIPKGIIVRDLNLPLLRGALDECFKASIEMASGYKPATISIANPAITLDSRPLFKDQPEVTVYWTDALKAVKPVQPGTKDFNQYKNALTTLQKNFIDEKIAEVNTFRVHLKYTIPAAVTAIEKTATECPELANGFIKEQEAKVIVMSKNPLASAKDKAMANEELQKIKFEKERILQLATQVLNQTKVLSPAVNKTVDSVTANLKSLYTE